HAAFAERIAFGKDLVFTFGPLGFLYVRGYFPATYRLLMLLRTFLVLVLWSAAFTIARRVLRQPVRALVWLIAFLAVVASDILPDIFFLTLSSLLLVSHFCRRAQLASLHTNLLILALAIAGLVKFSFFTAAAATVTIVTLDEVLRLRRVPRILPAYVGATLVVW